MALTFCDGFDSYAATADLLKKWAMATAPWAWSATADQNGATGGIVTAVATTGGAILSAPANTFGVASSRVGVGFWLKISATPAARANLMLFLGTGVGSAPICRISVETSGFLSLQNHVDTTLLTGSTNVCTNAWLWVEITPQDGVTMLQRCVVGTTSQWNTTVNLPLIDTFSCLQFLAIANRTVSISDVMCYDDSGTFTVAANFPLTARKITTVRPNGDDVVQLARSTGSTSYTLVDDVAGDTTDYVEGFLAGQDTYDYAALGFTPTLVDAVMVNSFVTMSDMGVRNFKPLAKSGATTTEGASTTAVNTPLVKQQPYYVDPNTAAAWTQTGIDAAKFGIKVEGPTSMVLYCGQTAPGGIASSYSFPSVYIGPEHSSRLVVALFYGQTNNRTVGNVTIGGVAATINIQSNDAGTNFDDVGLCIASLVVPAGTTATIAMAWDGFCDLTGLMVYAIYGASSATPIDTVHGASSSVNPTGLIDASNNGAIIALYMNMGNPTVSWTGLNSKNADFNVSGGGGTSRISTAHQAGLSSETNRTITAVQSSYPEMGAFIAASWTLL